MELGVDGVDFSLLDSLWEDDTEPVSPPENDGTKSDSTDNKPTEENTADDNKKSVDDTKVFAKRLQEKTTKAIQEERERIAKEFGFDSYEAMRQSQEKKLLEEKGLTPDDVSGVVNEIVEKRLNEDPRMKELEDFRKQRTKEFAQKELEELTKLTDGEIKSLNQVPKDVIDEWTKTGSLKGAYLKLHGEELIAKVKSGQLKSSTDHLQTPSGGGPKESDKRYLTAEEKAYWKQFFPNITEEELNKKTVNK